MAARVALLNGGRTFLSAFLAPPRVGKPALRFRTRPPAEKEQTFGFMRAMLLILVLFCASAAVAEQEMQTEQFSTAWEDLTVASVSYGVTGDRLHFVVFESAHEHLKHHATLIESTSSS